MPWQLDQLDRTNVLFELGADAWMLATRLTDTDTEEEFSANGRTGVWRIEALALADNCNPRV